MSKYEEGQSFGRGAPTLESVRAALADKETFECSHPVPRDEPTRELIVEQIPANGASILGAYVKGPTKIRCYESDVDGVIAEVRSEYVWGRIAGAEETVRAHRAAVRAEIARRSGQEPSPSMVEGGLDDGKANPYALLSDEQLPMGSLLWAVVSRPMEPFRNPDTNRRLEAEERRASDERVIAGIAAANAPLASLPDLLAAVAAQGEAIKALLEAQRGAKK